MAEQIGRYEIRHEIGRGGMATVYLAYDPRIQRRVAIKVLPRQFTHDPKYLERFQQEAHMIAALEHPAIVPIHDFGEHNDAPYLVMRYMAGGNLRSRLRGEPLSLEDIAAALSRLAPALDYAHDVGVVHRDLKPANILFDHQGNPYLADFGIARMAEASQTMTIIGTPAYMSPEQVESEVKLDGRSDIYALGVILYELLTGKQPYTAETPTGQMLMHVTKPVPNILEANPDLPPGTQQVIEKAMAKDREERYQSAVDLATAVSGLLDGEAAAPGDAAAATTAKKAAEVKPEPDVAGPSSEMEPQVDAAQEDGEGFPGWAWWVGALALLVIVGLGIRAILGDGDDESASAAVATSTMEVAVAAALTDSATTATPMEQVEGEEQSIDNQAGSADEAKVTPMGTVQPTETLLPTDESGPMAEPTESPLEESNSTATDKPNVPPLVAELGDNWERSTDGMTMVYVPRGSFMMGSNTIAEYSEIPVHEVSLDAFWIDYTEVTIEQYTLCVEEGSCLPLLNVEYKDDDYPIINVSWYDAEMYCGWVNARLPTEAEWEFAARGTDGRIFPWGDKFEVDKANFCDLNCSEANWKDNNADDGYAFTAPIGSYPTGASWVGALDMAGNVWEWVDDWYDKYYYANSPVRNPQGPNSGDKKVMRGGSWNDTEFFLRSATRYGLNPDYRDDNFGFRCVVSPSVAKEATVAVATATPYEAPIEEPNPTSLLTATPTEALNTTPTVNPNVPPLNAQLGDAWMRQSDGMTMVYVPEGSFAMGSEEGNSNEAPVHEVSLDAFWIDRTEVTNDQFAQFVEVTGYETTAEKEGSSYAYSDGEWQDTRGADWQHPQGPDSGINGLADHPVIHVSWYDAEAYCEWAEARLPTEAEWEYAARGPDGSPYPWGDSFDGQTTNLCDVNCPLDWADESVNDGYEFTSPAGSYPAGESWVGALDMSGNVWEWTHDWYGETYYADSPGHNPQGPDSGDNKVLRGGSWADDEFILRSAARLYVIPDIGFVSIGFRCVELPGN